MSRTSTIVVGHGRRHPSGCAQPRSPPLGRNRHLPSRLRICPLDIADLRSYLLRICRVWIRLGRARPVLDRDLGSIARVHDRTNVRRLLAAVAATTGSALNLADFARDLGIAATVPFGDRLAAIPL